MSDQNYSPPQATLESQPAKPAGAWRIVGAVALAFVVDVIGTTALTSALAAAFFTIGITASGGVDDGLIDHYRHATSTYDNPWGIGMFVIGSVMSIIGGQLCARLARGREWRALGWLCVVHILYSLYRGSAVHWGWWEANAVTLSSVLLGFGWRMRTIQSARPRQQTTTGAA